MSHFGIIVLQGAPGGSRHFPFPETTTLQLEMVFNSSKTSLETRAPCSPSKGASMELNKLPGWWWIGYPKKKNGNPCKEPRVPVQVLICIHFSKNRLKDSSLIGSALEFRNCLAKWKQLPSSLRTNQAFLKSTTGGIHGATCINTYILHVYKRL